MYIVFCNIILTNYSYWYEYACQGQCCTSIVSTSVGVGTMHTPKVRNRPAQQPAQTKTDTNTLCIDTSTLTLVGPSVLCIPCFVCLFGLFLARDVSNDLLVRHFGRQMGQHLLVHGAARCIAMGPMVRR
mmetsp:Transcript_15450/g.42703  ORF Transcript_15450/g.42703 Transcript_15450/m.42703 type:complete len:129 (+) Transcript_15450:34-420(+)